MSKLLLIAVTALLAAGGLAFWQYPAAVDPLWMAGAAKDLVARRFGADLLAVFALAGTLPASEPPPKAHQRFRWQGYCARADRPDEFDRAEVR